uniref:Uncharacterized protein n=1 Tax=Panagrellus redivivus TaxID=6233 RepID=A0A7E4V783_PANRE
MNVGLTLDLKPAPSVSEMAECLEDQHDADSDRAMDSCNFLREQFDIFKHDYREAFDNHGHETLANLTLSPALKKDVVNSLRRLQRAKVVIDNTNISPTDRKFVASLSEKIHAIEEELERVVRGKTEFSASNVSLPEFDADAISALFGNQDPHIKETPANNAVEELCDFNKQFTEKVNEVLGAAELLLNEYTEFETYVKNNTQ